MSSKLSFIFIGLLFSVSVFSQNKIEIQIKSFPSYTSENDELYIAGNFNGWNPKNEKFKFDKEDGEYSIKLKLDNGLYEYKITRGGWDKVECKKGGTTMLNRHINVQGNATTEIIIEEWQDKFPPKPKISTASRQVHIIDTAFFIPQLKRKRRIWIYLPEDYFTISKRYPVLYMHDGQNVFDELTAPFGEWGVDEFLDTAKKKSIVVAIDNGLDLRLNEYSPYDLTIKEFPLKSTEGEGNEYVDFIVKTLKPFIDKNYRTLKDKTKTFIAGSSMGGLISMYAILKYPKVFGGAGVFSPAFWVGPGIFNDIEKKGKVVDSRIYFYAGKLESDFMVPDMLKAFDKMYKISRSKMITVIRDEGRHNEATWRTEFPLFYEWIMK
jgi:predicted alpha/beta superfamily hydrolase